ncbi:terminase small subunit [Aurantimonas coralicida]|uniref:terminase small subunit n=1 Tax=Aurantimonas coralicida TaxID=182270 RepID=UPI001E5F397F|nr:terminase small subunit [Aurantimonas coralicida]MCD1644151.1 terminase small subunit [Aurantimonas coralicida]
MLTPKQERFVQEYLVDLNATQAAIRTGYSAKTAKQQGQRLLTNADVQAAVSAAREEASERSGVTIERALQEMARLGFSDIRNIFTEGGQLKHPSSWDDATAAAVSSVKVVTRPTGGEDENGNKEVEHVHEIKLWDKNSALDKIGKHLGMFIDRGEIKHTISHEDALSLLG